MNKKKIIETVDLTKIYKLKGKSDGLLALNKVNLSILEGEKFGLLGPNGAGKTTLIQILTTLKQPTTGKAYINGIDVVKKPNQAKSYIGLMLDSGMLYYRITGYDNLKFFCKIYNVPNYKEKINKYSKEFGLDKWLNQYVENFSSGMKMKLALCRTLLLNRKILFLDEPTLGLDVKTISIIVDKLKKANFTIFLTSHDMNVVEKLCDRVAFIDKGKILKIGNPKEIAKLMQNEIKIEISIKNKINQIKSELNAKNYITNVLQIDNGFIISLKDKAYYQDLFRVFSNYELLSINEIELSLEDLFLQLT